MELGLNDGFAESLSMEFGEALAIRKGFIKKPHAVERNVPHHKGRGLHTRSEHRSHGPGSFCRTHSHPTCRR